MGFKFSCSMRLDYNLLQYNLVVFEETSFSYFSALDHLEKLCVLLHDNLDVLRTDIKFTEEEETLKKPSDDPKPTDNEQEAESKTEDTGDGKSGEILYKVNGCILTMINRLATEFIKILQDSDCHSTDYIDKLVETSSSRSNFKIFFPSFSLPSTGLNQQAGNGQSRRYI